MYLKSLLIITNLLIVFSVRGQQKTKAFKVIDQDTKTAIPYAQLSIVAARFYSTIDKGGMITVPGNLINVRDTMVINAQNYAPFKLSLKALAATTTIELKKLTPTPAVSLLRKYKKEVVLNDYNSDLVGHYAGMPAENAPFNYLQIAQFFQTDAEHNHVVKININKTRGMALTKFRVRIYDVDITTGGPGNDICDKIIDVDNFDEVEEATMRRTSTKAVIEARVIDIDLKKANVVIPVKRFYIAVEWLRSQSNMAIGRFYNPTAEKFESVIVYLPFIGLSPVTGKKLNI
jgi:hypothetical protein